MPDPIFSLLNATEALWKEIGRLVEAVPDAFKAHGIAAKYKIEEDLGDESYGRIGYQFEVTAPLSRQRRPRQFLFAFDMWRTIGDETWENARDALLTFAYAPDYADPWGLEQVVVGSDGWLADPDARSECFGHADGRLLEWGNYPGPWHGREWLFSVPLLKIDGHQAFTRHIVEPVVALLKGSKEPADALAGGDAIKFVR